MNVNRQLPKLLYSYIRAHVRPFTEIQLQKFRVKLIASALDS